jgi:hypothetical protein
MIVAEPAPAAPVDELALQPGGEPAPQHPEPELPPQPKPRTTGAAKKPTSIKEGFMEGMRRAKEKRAAADEGKPKPTKNQQVLGCVGAVGGLIFMFFLFRYMSAHSATGMPSALPAPPAGHSVEQNNTRRAAALDDMIHEFERTDGAQWIGRDHIRAILFVVLKSVPEKRQTEALNDLLTVSKFAPDAWNYIREPELGGRDYAKLGSAPLMSKWSSADDVLLNLEFSTKGYENLPKGVKDSFQQFVTSYFTMSQQFSKQGTTVEAEAKKTLGE